MENSISSDLIRGHIDTIILYSLTDCDKYAQEISDYVYNKSENKYEINQATLYSSLKRLENLQYVKAYWNDAEEGRRRFFKITQKGLDFIDTNLSNWDFSRSIIDKLLNKSYSNENVKVVEVIKEKIVEKPVYIEKEVIKQDNQNLIQKQSSPTDILNNNSKIDLKQNFINVEQSSIYSITQEKENNFRNILNGLCKVTKIVEENIEKSDDVLSSSSEEQLLDKIQQKNKDNLTKYNIDFTDLELKANNSGYKIKFSSIYNKNNKNKVYINKVNFISSIFISFLIFIEMFLLLNINKGILSINNTISYIIYSICFIPFIVFAVLFLSNKKKISKKPKVSSVVSSIVVFFDLVLVLFLIEWLLSFDFTNKFNLLLYFVFPIIILFDFSFFFFIRYYISKKQKNIK